MWQEQKLKDEAVTQIQEDLYPYILKEVMTKQNVGEAISKLENGVKQEKE